MPKETSKYRPEYDKQAEKCCQFGGNDEDLARLFNVDVRTIYNWKQEHESFFHAVKKGKWIFDTGRVESTLLKKILGYEYKEVKVALDANGKAIPDQTIVTQKQAHPDTGAIIWWLKNRDPKNWRDKQEQVIKDERSKLDLSKLTDEELEILQQLHAKCESKE